MALFTFPVFRSFVAAAKSPSWDARASEDTAVSGFASGAEGLADGLVLRPVASLTQVGTVLGSVTTPAHSQLTAGGGALLALEAAVHHLVSPYLIPRVGIISISSIQT